MNTQNSLVYPHELYQFSSLAYYSKYWIFISIKVVFSTCILCYAEKIIFDDYKLSLNRFVKKPEASSENDWTSNSEYSVVIVSWNLIVDD